VGNFNAETLRRALIQPRQKTIASIDLSRARFVTPAASVAVCAFAERAIRKGKTVSFVSPLDPDVATYLSRMRLGRVLIDLGVGHDLPTVREHDVGDSLRELQAFDAFHGVDTLAEHVRNQVAPINGAAADVLYGCIAALGENVGEHAKRAKGYFVAQTYGRNRLLFAVGDGGRGFFRTLRDRGADSDAQALEMALRPGISQSLDASRGYGLHEMLTNLRKVGGELTLHSGQAARRELSTGESSWTGGPAHIRGAVLEGTIPLR
jgi:hypothetical protein